MNSTPPGRSSALVLADSVHRPFESSDLVVNFLKGADGANGAGTVAAAATGATGNSGVAARRGEWQ